MIDLLTKETFCKTLLSRYLSMDDEVRYNFLLNLAVATLELNQLKVENIEATDDFKEWVENLRELIFPEVLSVEKHA